MIQNLYVIRDNVAEESGPIYEAKNHQVAARRFKQMLKDVEGSESFELLCVGRYDHDNDVMVKDIEPEKIFVDLNNKPLEVVDGK